MEEGVPIKSGNMIRQALAAAASCEKSLLSAIEQIKKAEESARAEDWKTVADHLKSAKQLANEWRASIEKAYWLINALELLGNIEA
jgi:hypothetical protein